MAINPKVQLHPSWVVHIKWFPMDPITPIGSGVEMKASHVDIAQSQEQKTYVCYHVVFEMIAFVSTQDTPNGDSWDWVEKQKCAVATGHPGIVSW